MVTVVEVFDSGVECIKRVSATKDRFRSWLESKRGERVGKPSTGSDCPLFHFFSEACPELVVVSVGTNVSVRPTNEREYLAATSPGHYALKYPDESLQQGGYAQKTVQVPDWCRAFIYRLDDGWNDMQDTGITGELALGILERAEDVMPETRHQEFGEAEKAFRAAKLPETLPTPAIS